MSRKNRYKKNEVPLRIISQEQEPLRKEKLTMATQTSRCTMDFVKSLLIHYNDE